MSRVSKPLGLAATISRPQKATPLLQAGSIGAAAVPPVQVGPDETPKCRTAGVGGKELTLLAKNAWVGLHSRLQTC